MWARRGSQWPIDVNLASRFNNRLWWLTKSIGVLSELKRPDIHAFRNPLQGNEEPMFAFKAAVFLLVFASSLASCQVSPHHESSNPTNGDLFFGAVFNSNNPGNGTAGLGGGASFRVYRVLEVVGEFDSYIGSPGVANTTTLLDYMVGPRFSMNHGSRLSPFADFMAGGQYLHNGSTQHSYYYANGGGAALAADGGIDIRLVRHLALRAQAGFIHSTFATPPTRTSNDRLRAATFLVFRF
jgi:hypothetical protein